jgi:hypothetical protein
LDSSEGKTIHTIPVMGYTALALEDGSRLKETLARVGHGHLERRHIVRSAVAVVVAFLVAADQCVFVATV